MDEAIWNWNLSKFTNRFEFFLAIKHNGLFFEITGVAAQPCEDHVHECAAHLCRT